uniref:Uncharacterized protein n=1 Tax=Maylandia zebra TaxID=106582 RepID=A0A3P9D6Y1_9CICH
MVLSRKRVECPLRVGDEFLPQVEEFKYLGVLFASDGRRELEIDRRIGAAAAVMRTLHRSVVVKRELSVKAKLSIYRSIYVPTLTYGHELWVVTERTRSRIQAAEMSFLRRVAGLSLRDRVRSSAIREGLRVEQLLLHIERSQLRWFGHLARMPPGRLLGEVFQTKEFECRHYSGACERFPLQLSHAITRGDRGHPEERRSMVRIVVEAMQVNCRNPKRASSEEVAKIIVNRYPQTFADFTEKGERLGCGHYSLLRSIKSRVEHVNQDNTTHRLRQTKRTRNEEDCNPSSNATSPKKVRCLVDSYGCINWQPEKKHILLTIFNLEGPGAVERPDVDDFMCLTYISQRQLINSCPSLSVAEIQEQWPFLFTWKGLSNHFYKLTGIDISERLGQALITKGRRIINYFSSQKLKWNLDVSFFHTETSTRMSLEAEINLPSTPRLIMLVTHYFKSQLNVTVCYYLLWHVLRFSLRINPEEGTKCTSKVGRSRKTGTTVSRKVVHINPHVTTFLQRLTEFEWRTSN